jgi:hypothetical protein
MFLEFQTKKNKNLVISAIILTFASDKPIVELKNNTMRRKKICVENGVFHPILVWGKNLYFAIVRK